MESGSKATQPLQKSLTPQVLNPKTIKWVKITTNIQGFTIKSDRSHCNLYYLLQACGVYLKLSSYILMGTENWENKNVPRAHLSMIYL